MYEIFHEICADPSCGSCGQLTGLPISKCGPGIKLCRSCNVCQSVCIPLLASRRGQSLLRFGWVSIWSRRPAGPEGTGLDPALNKRTVHICGGGDGGADDGDDGSGRAHFLWSVARREACLRRERSESVQLRGETGNAASTVVLATLTKLVKSFHTRV